MVATCPILDESDQDDYLKVINDRLAKLLKQK